MTNYAAARTHMVDSQIHTMGVVNEAILEAFRTVPREQFVPTDRMGVAYNDEDLAVGPGRKYRFSLDFLRFSLAIPKELGYKILTHPLLPPFVREASVSRTFFCAQSGPRVPKQTHSNLKITENSQKWCARRESNPQPPA